MTGLDFLDELENAPQPVADGPVLEFKVNRLALDKALAEVTPALPSGDILPVLKDIHVRAEEGTLVLTASDSSVTLLAQVAAEVTTAGSSLLSPNRFHTIVREASGDTVHVFVFSKNGGEFATIKAGTATWNLPLRSGLTYPDFSWNLKTETTEIEAEPFVSALKQVRKAASTDIVRLYYMLIDISKGRIRASDGTRFQQVKQEFPFDCQIPIRAANMVVQKASGLSTIEVGQTEKALLFRFGTTLLVAQKTSANFPDVDEVLLLPTLSNDQTFTVNRADFLAAIRRVRVTADEKTAAVVLSLNKGSVSVQSKDSDHGTTVDTVDSDWNLSPRHISFNHEYLSDMLLSTTAETCVFKLGKELVTKPSPLLLEDPDSGLIAVLSQIRLDWL